MKHLRILPFLAAFLFFIGCQTESIETTKAKALKEKAEKASASASQKMMGGCTISDDIGCDELTENVNSFLSSSFNNCVNITPCPPNQSCVYGGVWTKSYSFNIDSDSDVNANTEFMQPLINHTNNLISSIGGVCDLNVTATSSGCSADPGKIYFKIEYYVCGNDCSLGNDVDCDDLFSERLPDFLSNDLENCMNDLKSCPPGYNCTYAGNILRYYSYYVDSDSDVNADTEIVNNIIADANLIASTYGACKIEASLHKYSGCKQRTKHKLCISFKYYTCERGCDTGIGNDEDCKELFSELLPKFLDQTIYNCYDVVKYCPRGYTCENVTRFINFDVVYGVDSDSDVNAYDQVITPILNQLDALFGANTICWLDVVMTSKPTCFRGKNKVGFQIRYRRCVRRIIIDDPIDIDIKK